MKRILVIDESEVVRETLALILGGEFAVSKRALGAQGLSFADSQNDVDLLILGISPHLRLEPSSLMRFAAQLPFAVLLLVDSKSIAHTIQHESQLECLTKPFNPYELHEKVGRLLARRPLYRRTDTPASDLNDASRYLEFPYLSRSAATLVSRLASARLPLLVSGEIGCGQERVVSGIQRLHRSYGLQMRIDAAEVNADYLSQKIRQLSLHEGLNAAPTTLVVYNLDKISTPAQALLVTFIEEVEERFDEVRYLATAEGDLLEKVYRSEFLEALYYKLATLTLKLPPLRDRRDDIPVLAVWFARMFAKALRLDEPTFSPEANSRLANYLWFGNLNELETVIARTLAVRRKASIEVFDLVFDFGEAAALASETGDFTEYVPGDTPGGRKSAPPHLQLYGDAPAPQGSANGRHESVDLNVVIHELAHEFKNPMVTIKTFAQLLGDRYQDENFRTRFQEVVGGDIERMDELIEMMIEFADFAEPRKTDVALDEKLREALTEIHGECAKRQTRFEWKESGATHVVRADESHLSYILRNVLMAALMQTKMGSEIEVEVARDGAVAISYPREGARVSSIAHYLDKASAHASESILPLRVLLAKHLVEKNGGRFGVDPSDGERETLRMEFSIAEHRKES
jgi:DNA-binding NtrC family response regulator